MANREFSVKLSVEAGEGVGQLDALNSQIANTEKELRGLKKGTDEYIAANKKLSDSKEQYASLQKQIGLTGLTVGQLKKQYANLSKELNQLIPGTQAYIDKSAEMQKVSARLGKVKQDVGGVGQALTNLVPGFDKIGAAKEKFGSASQGVSGLVKNFGLLKGAIISTGIGVLVVLLGSLFSWMSKNDAIMTKVEGVMNAMGAAIEVIGNRVAKLITGDFVGAFKGAGDEIAKAAKAGYDLADALDKVEDRARAVQILNSGEEVLLAKLLLQSKNRTIATKERINLLNQAEAVEIRIHKRALAQGEAEFALIKKANDKKRSRGTIDDVEGLQKEADAFVKLNQLRLGSVAIQEKINNRRDALEDRALEQSAKRLEAAKKAQEKAAEDRRKLIEKTAADQTTTENKASELRVALITDTTTRSIVELQRKSTLELAELNKSLATDTAVAETKRLIEAKLAQDIATIRKEAAKKAEDEEKALFDKVIQIGARKEIALAEQAVRQAKTLEASIIAQESLIIAQREKALLDETLLQEERFNILADSETKIAEMKTKALADNNARDLEASRVSIDAVTEIGNSILSIQATAATEEIRQQEAKKNQRLSILDGQKQAGLISEEQYQSQRQLIESHATEESEKIRKAQAQREAAFAIATAWAKFAIESAGYFASPQSIATGGILGGILSGVALARTIALNVATTSRTQYEQGGYVQPGQGGLSSGPRHSKGGIKMIANGRQVGEMEGGEAILSRKFVLNNPLLTRTLLQASMHQSGRLPRADKFETGGIAPTAITNQLQNLDTDPIVKSLNALRIDLSTWQSTFKVINVLTETQSGLDTIKKVQQKATY